MLYIILYSYSCCFFLFFFFSSRRRHTRCGRDWSSDVCSSDLAATVPPGGKTLSATFKRPYQMHGSIGPSCAIAQFNDGELTVWSHGQGMFPLRASIAELLHLPKEKVRCIHVEGSGCYGHNGADDAGAGAACHSVPRTAGASAMDARPGAYLGALRSGHAFRNSRQVGFEWQRRRFRL